MNEDNVDHDNSVNADDFDHYSREMAYNPWPRWQRLRAGPPLAYSPKYGGFWIASRYKEVCDAVRRTDVFSSFINQTGIPPMEAPRRPPINFDPPEHTFYRTVLNPFFTPAKMKECEPWIRDLAAGYIRPLAQRDGFNLPREIGIPLTRDVIARIMGIAALPEAASVWADDLIFSSDVPTRQNAAKQLLDFLAGELEKRRADPGTDVMTALTTVSLKGRGLNHEEQLGASLLLLLGGLDTTNYTLAGAVWYLVQHPEAQKRLAGLDENGWPIAIDEFVRWVSPAPHHGRTAKSDTEIGGCPVRKGEKVWLIYGSANRDETEFKDPDAVVLDRFPNRHLGFGMGPHRCLGSHLAKLVLTHALRELLRILPDFELQHPDAVHWHGAQVRGINSLPLVRIQAGQMQP
jgi:cytochrome P450